MARTTACRKAIAPTERRNDRRRHPLVGRQSLLVLLATAILVAWGLVALSRTPLDAIPDLSDVQVIVRTTFPGQAPQVVEDQVTYPLTTTLLSVPQREVGARLLAVRRIVRIRAVRRRHRSVLGALARTRVSVAGAGAAAGGRIGGARARMRPGSAGSTNTRWSIAAGRTTSANCARCRIGSSSSN